MKSTIFTLALIFTIQLSVAQTTYTKLNDDTTKVVITHDNGNVAQTGILNENNKLHGQWTMYDKQNNIIATAYYVNGKKYGKWSFTNKGITTYVTYKANKVIKTHIDNTNNTVVSL